MLIDDEVLAHRIPTLLVHLRGAKVRSALILADLEVMNVCAPDDTETVPDQIAELVVDVSSCSGMQVWSDEYVAIREGSRLCDVQERGK